MKTVTILKAGTASLALGLAMASAPSFAQSGTAAAAPEDTTANADGSADTAGPIVVTGSRIARPNIEAPSPVTVVGAEQVALTGTTNVETLLNELPQVIPGNTRVSNNSGGENFATIDLRGLGPGRTLILLNGERLPASSTTGVTDVSQIPTGLIERVEVMTGGASAVYGSDAIAGVVNFILKDNYEGVELTGQTSVAEIGTGFGYSMSGLVGGNFADGRGNMTFYGSYTDRSGVFQGRLPYSQVSGALYYDPAQGIPYIVQSPADVVSGAIPYYGGGSATPPWGWISNSASNPFQNLGTLLPSTFGAGRYDTNCDGVANTTPYNTGNLSFNDSNQLTPRNASGLCNIPLRSIGSSRYNYGPINYLITPYDRISLTTVGRYELSDSTRLRVYASYTNANQEVALAPTPATGISVPYNSPLIPNDLKIALASRPNPTANFTINRRFSETGARVGDFTTDSKTVRAVIEHDFNDTWSGSVVASYGRVDNKIRNSGNIRASAVQQGLNNCPAGSAPGCVPINIFGANTLTPAMLSFVALNTTDTETFDQLRVAANITGSLFELPGGPLGVAVGAEYRRDAGSTLVDDAKRTGDIIGFNAQNDIVGRVKTKEVYGELRAPILDFVTLGAGARYSNYTSVGDLFNWKVDAEITPAPWVKLRASYNRAARAPNVFELFQAGDQGFPSYGDPCNSKVVNGVPTASAYAAQCIAQGVPAAQITTFSQVNSQVQAFAFGQPDLQEEKAETYTAGLVLTPGDILGGRLSFTADYYHINLTNRISTLGASYYLTQCYVANDPAACTRVVRDPTTGQVNYINTGRFNSPTPLTASGVDVGLDFSRRFAGGTFYLSDVLSYTDEYTIGTTNYADTVFSGIGGVTPNWANTLTAGWRNEHLTAQIRHVWKQGARQGFDGSECQAYGDCDVDANGIPVQGFRIPDLSVLNASLRWQTDEHFEFTFIVNNLLDKLPPLTYTGFFEQANTNINFYDPYALGRNYTIQAKVKF